MCPTGITTGAVTVTVTLVRSPCREGWRNPVAVTVIGMRDPAVSAAVFKEIAEEPHAWGKSGTGPDTAHTHPPADS